MQAKFKGSSPGVALVEAGLAFKEKNYALCEQVLKESGTPEAAAALGIFLKEVFAYID